MGVYYGMNRLWVPVGGQGASVDSDLLAENIKSGVTINGITGTFTNDATATASDMAEGITAYVNGEKVTGSLPEKTGSQSFFNSTPKFTKETGMFNLINEITADQILRTGAKLYFAMNTQDFGDATAADVASGKTFTSSAGLKVTGTGSNGGGATVTNVITVSPKAYSIGIPCSKKPKGVTVFRDLFKSTTEATETTTAIIVTVLSYHEDTTTIASGGFNVKSGLCSVGTQAYSDIISGVTYSGGLLLISLTSPHYFKGDYIAILYY